MHKLRNHHHVDVYDALADSYPPDEKMEYFCQPLKPIIKREDAIETSRSVQGLHQKHITCLVNQVKDIQIIVDARKKEVGCLRRQWKDFESNTILAATAGAHPRLKTLYETDLMHKKTSFHDAIQALELFEKKMCAKTEELEALIKLQEEVRDNPIPVSLLYYANLIPVDGRENEDGRHLVRILSK